MVTNDFTPLLSESQLRLSKVIENFNFNQTEPKRLVPIEHDDLTGRDKECFVEEMTLWPVICRSALVSNYAKRRYDADPMPQKHTYIPFI